MRVAVSKKRDRTKYKSSAASTNEAWSKPCEHPLGRGLSPHNDLSVASH